MGHVLITILFTNKSQIITRQIFINITVKKRQIFKNMTIKIRQVFKNMTVKEKDKNSKKIK